ncbi:Neuropeptide-Like Protein [Caenorhabditis elegans]|uniref:Neuropeptide-Like Protein n=1 Tax=Caenorhabditis elegans TaxID=6239 RepID=Q9XWL6_CAEEL|nr:Neuropeptide-Like Protein [Caenorhabditis elegans]CAA21640.1 Neuropeptide-Like Protein [Caenorhabditis elegans]|eukprot:NP_507769.1 Uncharacterized protein CELE_Y43F8A.1 [Caenorhabditis elegans]
MKIAVFLVVFALFIGVFVQGQRVFDMMDEKASNPGGRSAIYQRKSYLQPFYNAPTQLFWRRY